MNKCISCKVNEVIKGTSLCQSCLGVAVGNHASMLGKLGGLATRKKYGKEHYQKLAANMNKKRWGINEK